MRLLRRDELAESLNAAQNVIGLQFDSYIMEIYGDDKATVAWNLCCSPYFTNGGGMKEEFKDVKLKVVFKYCGKIARYANMWWYNKLTNNAAPDPNVEMLSARQNDLSDWYYSEGDYAHPTVFTLIRECDKVKQVCHGVIFISNVIRGHDGTPESTTGIKLLHWITPVISGKFGEPFYGHIELDMDMKTFYEYLVKPVNTEVSTTPF